jgi:transcriptional regulator with XRE-family HTH domain
MVARQHVHLTAKANRQLKLHSRKLVKALNAKFLLADMAEVVGMSQSYLSGIATGKQKASSESYLRLYDFFRLTRNVSI